MVLRRFAASEEYNEDLNASTVLVLLDCLLPQQRKTDAVFLLCNKTTIPKINNYAGWILGTLIDPR